MKINGCPPTSFTSDFVICCLLPAHVQRQVKQRILLSILIQNTQQHMVNKTSTWIVVNEHGLTTLKPSTNKPMVLATWQVKSQASNKIEVSGYAHVLHSHPIQNNTEVASILQILHQCPQTERYGFSRFPQFDNSTIGTPLLMEKKSWVSSSLSFRSPIPAAFPDHSKQTQANSA